jgi:hypothetical protein
VKYLKWSIILLGTTPLLFAAGLYALYFTYRHQNHYEISYTASQSLLARATDIVGDVAMIAVFLSPVLLLLLVMYGARKKQYHIGYIIFYLVGFAVLVFIFRFDNYHVLSWYLD